MHTRWLLMMEEREHIGSEHIHMTCKKSLQCLTVFLFLLPISLCGKSKIHNISKPYKSQVSRKSKKEKKKNQKLNHIVCHNQWPIVKDFVPEASKSCELWLLTTESDWLVRCLIVYNKFFRGTWGPEPSSFLFISDVASLILYFDFQ